MRTKDDTVDWSKDEERVYVETKRLAEVGDISPSWISQAARHDYICKGMPLAQWVVQDRYGQVVGFDIPKSVWDGLVQSQKYADDQ